MAFKMEPSDLRGIEVWYKQYREWVKEGRKPKYTEEEKDAIYKKCKVGKYRNWEFSETRYQEIVAEGQQDNKDKYRGKVYSWLRAHKPELADITWEQIVDLNLHKEMYTGPIRGKGRLTHLKEEIPDLEYM
jgi:hypothetical protein